MAPFYKISCFLNFVDPTNVHNSNHINEKENPRPVESQSNVRNVWLQSRIDCQRIKVHRKKIQMFLNLDLISFKIYESLI